MTVSRSSLNPNIEYGRARVCAVVRVEKGRSFFFSLIANFLLVYTRGMATSRDVAAPLAISYFNFGRYNICT